MTLASGNGTLERLGDLAGQVETWLAWLKAEGLGSLELPPEVAASLRGPIPAATPPASARSAAPRPAAAAPSPPPARGRPAPAPPPPPRPLPDWPQTPLPVETRRAGLEDLAARVAACQACPLHAGRTHVVPGEGSPEPEIMFVGEGPGFEEDRQGRPFVGPAGEILDRMIVKMGFAREEVYIANVVKCRAATARGGRLRDRPPEAAEMAACLPFLHEQIGILRPKVLVVLGNSALQGLLGRRGITRERGKWHAYHGIPALPTFHPSYLLREKAQKNVQPFHDVWSDMGQVLERLGRSPPA